MGFKGGHLDFSHLTEKRYKSSITKNHKIKRNIFFDGVPVKGYVTS